MNVSHSLRFIYVLIFMLPYTSATQETSHYHSINLLNTRATVGKYSSTNSLDPIVFNYLFSHDAEFAQSFAHHLNSIIQVFYQLVSNDIFLRAHACLILTELSLENPYNEMLQKTISELIPLYFGTDGCLISLGPPDISTRNFTIAQFLKNGIEYATYKKLLSLFNFTEVLAYEESTSCYLTENLYHIATGKWLPNFSWYPSNIKILIKEHPQNQVLSQFLGYCMDYDLVAADDFISTHTHPLFAPLYTELCAHKKKQLQHAWDIADDTPVYVHNALFELIHSEDNKKQCIEHIFGLLENRNKQELDSLHKAFFLEHGILKQFANFKEAQAYRFPRQIFGDHKLLKEINYLLYEQHIYGNEINGMIARITLDQLQAVYDAALETQTDCIDFDVEAALHPNFFSRVKMKVHSALEALQNLVS